MSGPVVAREAWAVAKRIELRASQSYIGSAREGDVVTSITVQLDDAKAKALRERAEMYGLKPEQLLTASIDDLIGQPDADFDEAARRVLGKNRELYRRLA